MKLLQQQPL